MKIKLDNRTLAFMLDLPEGVDIVSAETDGEGFTMLTTHHIDGEDRDGIMTLVYEHDTDGNVLLSGIAPLT